MVWHMPCVCLCVCGWTLMDGSRDRPSPLGIPIAFPLPTAAALSAAGTVPFLGNHCHQGTLHPCGRLALEEHFCMAWQSSSWPPRGLAGPGSAHAWLRQAPLAAVKLFTLPRTGALSSSAPWPPWQSEEETTAPSLPHRPASSRTARSVILSCFPGAGEVAAASVPAASPSPPFLAHSEMETFFTLLGNGQWRR